MYPKDISRDNLGADIMNSVLISEFEGAVVRCGLWKIGPIRSSVSMTEFFPMVYLALFHDISDLSQVQKHKNNPL